MIDFDKGRERLSNYGGSERKGAIEYNGELYMIKFPDRTREKKTTLSYINNQFSEHIGCQIFKSCGFETQDTELGYFTDYKGERKIVVGCKDFTQNGDNLYEFARLGKIIIGSDRAFATNLESVDEIIDNHRLIVDKDAIKARFWDMFVIDALLGNKDRHLGNWGLIDRNDRLEFAPIYDCGSTLSPLYDEELMGKLLDDPVEFKNKEYNVASCYKLGGKRLVYHEIFKNPPQNLQDAIKRVVPLINMNIICGIVDSVTIMPEIRKTYLKQALQFRFNEIILPAYHAI